MPAPKPEKSQPNPESVFRRYLISVQCVSCQTVYTRKRLGVNMSYEIGDGILIDCHRCDRFTDAVIIDVQTIESE